MAPKFQDTKKLVIVGALLLFFVGVALVVVLIAKPFQTTDKPVTKTMSEQITSSTMPGGFLMK
jgi:hypothetical protein